MQDTIRHYLQLLESFELAEEKFASILHPEFRDGLIYRQRNYDCFRPF